MKIVVFLFAFNISIYLLNTLGVYQFAVSSDNSWINYVFSKSTDDTFYQVDQNLLSWVGDIIGSIMKFVAFTAYAMFYPRGVLLYLGFPDIFAWTVQGMIIFAYIMAVIEFLSGRTMR